jgi:uncharacterized protein YceH (UPF0502 family)
MAVSLNPVELRVFGVLIEKSLALPAYYPMTLNAILAACNQKSSRDPVMELTDGQVASAVHQLQQWQLASQAPPEPGARANRFRHEAEGRFGWNAAQRAIMAELILRGPQTLAELRSRASRMARLESGDYARDLLRELMTADPAMVVELPRQTGQSATRFAQLLGGPVEAASQPAAVPYPASGGEASAGEGAASVEGRVTLLEEAVANLQASMAGLRQRLREAGILRDEP